MVSRPQSTHDYHPLTAVTSAWASLVKELQDHAARTVDARKDREDLRSKDDPAKEEPRS